MLFWFWCVSACVFSVCFAVCFSDWVVLRLCVFACLCVFHLVCGFALPSVFVACVLPSAPDLLVLHVVFSPFLGCHKSKEHTTIIHMFGRMMFSIFF